jgi:hypothetical protein
MEPWRRLALGLALAHTHAARSVPELVQPIDRLGIKAV